MQKLHHYCSLTYANNQQTNILQSHFGGSIYNRTLSKEPCSRLYYLYTSHVPGQLYPILDQNCLISTPHPRLNCLKTIPFTVAHTHIVYTFKYPPSPAENNQEPQATLTFLSCSSNFPDAT